MTNIIATIIICAIEFIKTFWPQLVKLGRILFTVLLKLKENIVNFFKSLKNWKNIKDNKHWLPIVVREKLKNGDYNVIAGIFDEEKNDMVDIENETQGFECERFDSELSGYFGDKDLIILKQ